MITYPNCKINLGLHVVRERDDGYHDLETIFLPAPLYDILEIVKADSFSFVQEGIPIAGSPDDNLVVKAFRMFQRETGIDNVAIRLTKAIPFGAGLGGGSSDAAFTLRMLDDLFELKLGREKLITMAASLGADCAFFIDNVPAYATGIGDKLTPLTFNPIDGFELRIEIPQGETVSTAEAYRGVTPRERRESELDHKGANRLSTENEANLIDAARQSPERWKELIVNDFEESVFVNHPRIAQLKQRFYDDGAIYASMTGSGAAVFGIWKKTKID